MYRVFSEQAEVIGQKIMGVIDANPSFKDIWLEMLAKHNLTNVQAQKWYKQQNWLDVFTDIKQKFGSNTIFNIGKSTVNPTISDASPLDLQGALDIINTYYQKCHRGGDVGSYQLKKFDRLARYAEMVSKNPYPDDFDRGMLTAICRKYKPKDSIMITVTLDLNLPNRLNGSLQSTYNIKW